jgi:hypothetical protein
MNSRTFVLLLLVQFVRLFAEGQTSPIDFPHPGPVPDADPTIVHETTVLLPVGLRLQRTPGKLSVAFDRRSTQQVKIMVGSNMQLGEMDRLRIYPEDEMRPLETRGVGLTGLHESPGNSRVKYLNGDPVNYFHLSSDGLPVLGKKYVVEEELSIFETDIPEQHHWEPVASSKYKVLWTGIIRQTAN